MATMTDVLCRNIHRLLWVGIVALAPPRDGDTWRRSPVRILSQLSIQRGRLGGGDRDLVLERRAALAEQPVGP